ncbi:MAG: class I SAM-dependent methyltransferase, partial [Tepidisphaeraceae bacterium]
LEINAAASEMARARGIDIVGQEFQAICESDRRFGVIVAIDVIEHVKDPRAFVAKLARALEPGGILLISTGNSDARAWRFMRGRYWYCALGEHISFINPRWISATALQFNLELVDLRLFSYSRRTPAKWLHDGVVGLSYASFPSFITWLRRRGLGYFRIEKGEDFADYPPKWSQARDHMMVLLRSVHVPLN